MTGQKLEPPDRPPASAVRRCAPAGPREIPRKNNAVRLFKD